MFRVAHEDGAEQLRGDLALRVKAHDSHRLQWVATVPLTDPGEQRTCEIQLDLAIPERIWRPHDPWQRLFVRTRLGSPRLWTGAEPLINIAESTAQVHHQALSAVHELKNTGASARSKLGRLARRRENLDDTTSAGICERIEVTMSRANDVRGRLEKVTDPALQGEAALAAEYVSTEVLRLATRLREGLRGEWPSRGARNKPLTGDTEQLQRKLEEIVEAEAQWREAKGHVVAQGDSRKSVDRFIHRSGLLKRHFQQDLFLAADVNNVEDRLGNWVAALVAIVASTWYFIWQVYYLNEAMAMGTTVISLAMAGLVAGLLYAVKDRIKELGRRYVQRLLKDHYADREVRLHLRKGANAKGRRLALARETIRESTLQTFDKVEGDLSGVQRFRVLSIRDVVSHKGGRDLQVRGITSVKHIFRYDLSPLFSSVDDLAKSIVVQTPDGINTVQTRRAYRIPVRARLFIDAARLPIIEQFGELVIRGRKLRNYRSSDESRAIWTDQQL